MPTAMIWKAGVPVTLIVLFGLPFFGFLLPSDRSADVGPKVDYKEVIFWYGTWMTAFLVASGIILALLDLRQRVETQETMIQQQVTPDQPCEEAVVPEVSTPNVNVLQTCALFMGFLSANYNVFAINFIKPIWTQFAVLAPSVPSMVSTAMIIGIIVGEVALGRLSDHHLGLRKAFLYTTCIVVVGAAITGLTRNFWAVAYFRFLTGIGVGGSYPVCASLAATAQAGHPQTRNDHCRTLGVFSSQGFALVIANSIAVIAVALLPDAPQVTWRVCSGAGALLAIVALGLFLQIPSGPQLPCLESHNTWKIITGNFVALLGTGGSWFLFDVMFYANSLFTSRVLQIVFGGSGSTLEVLVHNLLVTTIPLLGFAVSGIYFRFTHLSIKHLQIAGFCGMTLTYFVLAIGLDSIQRSRFLFVTLYALSFVFANAGPNSTTFVLPTIVYGDSVRSTCHGLSAAAGKLGAVVGTAAMDPLLNAYGLKVVLYISGSVGILGALVTVLFVPHSEEGCRYHYTLVNQGDTSDQ